MTNIGAVFYWMGGVITYPLQILIDKAILACGQSDSDLFSSDKFANSCDSFMLGNLDEYSFFQLICQIIGSKCSPEELRITTIGLLSQVSGTYQTINLLSATIQRWLIVDYPRSWLDQVRNPLAISSCFKDENLLFLQENHLNRLVPNVFDLMLKQSKLAKNQCLLVDNSSHRIVSAFDYGLQAIIFVDARRLEREYCMRKLVPWVPLEHRPGTVLQKPTI